MKEYLQPFILWTQFVESCWNTYKNYWIEKLSKPDTKEKFDYSDFSVKPWFKTMNDYTGAKWYSE